MLYASIEEKKKRNYQDDLQFDLDPNHEKYYELEVWVMKNTANPFVSQNVNLSAIYGSDIEI